MIKKIFNKILGRKPKTEAKPSFLDKISKKSDIFLEFLQDSKRKIVAEFFNIHKKSQNLHQTNFDLGLKHLENGHLKDASFRFFIMRKIWPFDYDAYYYHAYCLVLRGKNLKAKNVLIMLLEKNPNYDTKASELLDYINKPIS